MRHVPRPSRRYGIVMVEAAVVYPVTILLITGTIVIGLGVFRYQQIAYLAREGARWASVRGAKYQSEQKAPAATAAQVVTNAVVPRMIGLDASELSSTLTWNTAATPPTVTFTLSYRWLPETILPVRTFASSSTQIVTY